MKKLLLFVAIAITFSACKSYQMSTLSSSAAKRNESTGIFTVENDSVIVNYSFSGENTPVNVEVFNKLNEPVYINWAKSAVITDSRAYSYVNDEIQINGSSSAISTQFYRGSYTLTDGEMNATAKVSRDESFIPPHSKVTRTTNILHKVGMNDIDKAEFKKVFLTYLDGSGQFGAKTASFSEENSPLKFKSYLTLYTVKDNQPRPFTSELDFFVSSVTKSPTGPNQLYEYSNNPGDVFTIGKSTGFGKTIAVVGLVGAVGALTTAEAALDDTNKRKK